MRLDRLTVKAQEAIAEAQSMASQAGHANVTPLHLLDALLAQEGGFVVPLIEKVGVPGDRIKSVVSSELSRLPSQSSGGGMAIVVGRVRSCPVLDVKFVVLGHNTVRGAAGGSIHNAELLVAQGWVG